jgi:hypothetical protein
MSWTYTQAEGYLTRNGVFKGVGYSGAEPDGKNNPAAEAQKQVGPIPVGHYTIEGPPVDTMTHGPYVLGLNPDPANQMYGRSGFLIHGDSVVTPGQASKGCVILPRDVREKIWTSGERDLFVVAHYEKPA